MKTKQTRSFHTRRVVLSAMAVLAVSSSVLAPAFYSADLFRGITASAEAVEVDSGTVNNTILWKFYDDGTLWVSGEGSIPDNGFRYNPYASEIKRIIFDKNCKIDKVDMWAFGFDTNQVLTYLELNSTVPITLYTAIVTNDLAITAIVNAPEIIISGNGNPVFYAGQGSTIELHAQKPIVFNSNYSLSETQMAKLVIPEDSTYFTPKQINFVNREDQRDYDFYSEFMGPQELEEFMSQKVEGVDYEVIEEKTIPMKEANACSLLNTTTIVFEKPPVEFPIKHKVTPKDGYELPSDITEKTFTFSITPIDSAPAIATSGTWTYDEEAKEFVSEIELPSAKFDKLGDYWYEIKEKATDIANYIPDQNTYYLHIVTSNAADPGEEDNIGVTQAVLHKTYQQNVEQIKGANVTTNMTFALPEGYRNAYGEEGSLFKWNEGEDDQYQVGYYYAGDDDMDFDLYAWKKETIDGSPETAESVAEKEIAEGDYEDGEAPEIVKIAEFPFEAVYYDDEEEFEGTSYATRTYIIDDGEGNIVEFVFWLDEDDTNANTKMQAIIDSLALLPADKTDTLTGSITLSGALTINVTEAGTATSAADTFTVVSAFTFGDTVETEPTFNYTITNDGKDITENCSLTQEWENHVATLTFKDVPGGSIIKFIDLPDGISYKISESGLGEYFQNPVFTYTSDVDTMLDEDGVTLLELDAVFFGNELTDCYAEGTISDDNDAITISNTANVALDVGVFVENKPFMVIIGTASVLAAGAFISRRKRVDDAAIL